MAYTENIADFGYHQRKKLIKLLEAWNEHGLPDEFYDDNVRPALNSSSGEVFLVNDDYQVLMMNGSRLEEWYSLPYEGGEGFLEDLLEEWFDYHEEDREYLYHRAQGRGLELALRADKEPGSVCYSIHNEELGIVRDNDEAWFPSSGNTNVYYIEVEELPSEEDEDSEDEE